MFGVPQNAAFSVENARLIIIGGQAFGAIYAL